MRRDNPGKQKSNKIIKEKSGKYHDAPQVKQS